MELLAIVSFELVSPNVANYNDNIELLSVILFSSYWIELDRQHYTNC